MDVQQKKASSGESTADWEPPGQGMATALAAEACPSPPPMELNQPTTPALRVVRPGRDARVPNSPAGFRKKFFPTATAAQWDDWQWQLTHRITSVQELSRFLDLREHELAAFGAAADKPPLAITPYYLSLIDPRAADDPLRQCVVPTWRESLISPGESCDPLQESHDLAAPGLVHRYPDRVLLLATGFCSTYCRYCTRSRLVGGHSAGAADSLEPALAYIEANPQVRDVLISGGDPLTMSDGHLDRLLARLRRIDHVEIVRIGTKVPAVLPQRITPALTRMLKRYHPLFMSLHFTHPAELTPATARACARLADAGIPLGSQTVLLAGINDSVDTMRRLMTGLLKIRVRPYYLYQCDPIVGSAHLRTPVARGLEIMAGLRGHISGYAVPTYVIDAPGGGGKVPLYPETRRSELGGDLVLSNYEGGLYHYPDQPALGPWAGDPEQRELRPC